VRGGRAVAAFLVAVILAGCAATPPATPLATSTPAPSLATPAPTPTPAQSPEPPPAGPPLGPPLPSAVPTPSASPSTSPGPATGPGGRPTRVAVAALEIDLPVVIPPRNSTFPLCDVAEFFGPPAFQPPGADGVTYVYAHARTGMFLPILLASRRSGGRALIGEDVTVWTADNRRYTYRISRVRRFQKSLDWAFDLPPNSLVLQTSETPYRTGTKVMVVARQVGAPAAVAPGEAHPPTRPKACR